MLLIDYPSIRGGDLPDHAKKATCNLLHAYIDAYSQILIDEYPGHRVQDTTRFQPQCVNMIFADQSRYNRMFHQVIHKGGESEINYIKYFRMLRLRKFQS